MKQISEDELNAMLAQARQAVPDLNGEGAFESILQKATEPDAGKISFMQLRNTGIAMLLVIAVNVLIVSATVHKNSAETRQEETTLYLQPYNLNVY